MIELDKDKILEQLGAVLSERKHNFYDDPENVPAFEDWKNSGRPYVWVVVEQDEELELTVLADLSNGWIALFHKNDFIDKSTTVIIYEKANVTILEKNCFGVSKYIWK